METKNGYMTIQLLIPKGNNKQEFIDKIKNLKLTLSVIRTDFLNLIMRQYIHQQLIIIQQLKICR